VLAGCGGPVEEAAEEEAAEEEAAEEEAAEEEAAEEEAVTPAEGEPQYGGTMVWCYDYASRAEPPSPAIEVGAVYAQWWLTPIQERPLIGDFEKYGPKGTGEYSFQLLYYIPDQYLVGNWIDSWTVEPDKLTWHIRPGIMWSPNEEQQEWMPIRELTVDDAVADAKAWRASPSGGWFKDFVTDIYADGENMVMETSRFDVTWPAQLCYEDRTMISPPEMMEKGDSKYENQVGSGPFRFEEYVVGSHMSYTKNPIWRKTTTIDGVEYKLPFVDRLIMPVIPDEATRVAAFRTGKFDAYFRVPWDYQMEIEEHTPQLQAGYAGATGYHGFVLKCDEPPFDDLNVRRAISIGVDRKAFQDQVGLGETVENWYPLWPGLPETMYTPLDKCPADVQEVFEYDPAKAKQMIIDAGHPDGLKVDLWVENDAYHLDGAAMLVDQMSKIGVECSMVVKETLIFRGFQYGKTWSGMMWGGAIAEIQRPIMYLMRKMYTGEYYNYACFSDPEIDETLLAVSGEMDVTKRNAMLKQLGIDVMGLCVTIPCASARDAAYTWPWVKNWGGEINIGDHDVITLSAYSWLDQNLKKEMGY